MTGWGIRSPGGKYLCFWSDGMTRSSALHFVLSALIAVSASIFPSTIFAGQFDCIGINQLRELDPNLTGSDTTVAVVSRSITYLNGKPQNDYQPDLAHHSFAAGNFALHNDAEIPTEISAHSTAICSILFGKDPNIIDDRGIVSDANAEVFEFWYFLKQYVFTNTAAPADVISISIGTVFEDWWTRGIEALIEQYGLIVVAGIGNGRDAYDPPLYPAASSNVIAVGVVSESLPIDTNDSDIIYFAQPQYSTFGPTEDSRCKPDLVAPGNYLIANTNDPNGYELSGTYSSFATPVVAGTAALLRQAAKADPNLTALLSPQGGNCAVKAILMNSAKKLPRWHKGAITKDDDHQVPLDMAQGAGMLDSFSAYENLTAGRQSPGLVDIIGWDVNTITAQSDSEKSYQFRVDEPNEKVVTITATWNRRYQNSYPFDALPDDDIDIRLELWAFGSDGNGVLIDYSDSMYDNVEHIYCNTDPNYYNYEIVITTGSQISPDNSIEHPYGLAWTVTDAIHDLNYDNKAEFSGDSDDH